MPIYDYICNKCKLEQEHLVKNVDSTVICKDESCKHTELTRQVSTGTNFKLMGTGWSFNH